MSGPLETVSVTVSPLASVRALAGGLTATEPSSSSEMTRSAAILDLKPASCSSPAASSSSPITSGTSTGAPLLTASATAEPGRRSVPGVRVGADHGALRRLVAELAA